MKLYIVLSKIRRLELSTSYAKFNTPTTRLEYLFLDLYFHDCTYPIPIFIHKSSNERDVYHASHVTHERQMAIMHHMHFMLCMHVLYPTCIICMGELIKRGQSSKGRNQGKFRE